MVYSAVSTKEDKPYLRPNLLNKSIFIHMPKTGGTTIREHFNERRWWRQLGVGHGNLEDFAQYKDLFSFTFVRHPREWLISYWKFYPRNLAVDHKLAPHKNLINLQKTYYEEAVKQNLQWKRWNCKNDIVSCLWDKDLNVFLQRVCNHVPNIVDLCYRYFTYDVTFIGKTESLCKDLVTALDLAGEDPNHYNRNVILSWDRDRRNRSIVPNITYDEKIMDEIIKANPLIMTHYST